MKLLRIFSYLAALSGLVLGLSQSAFAGPTPAEYGVVLNLSGKQRMLSQKMSKEVTLVALNVDVENNIKNLAATSALFDKTLKGLRDGDASLGLPPTESKRILRQLDKVAEIWTGFYPVIQDVIASKAVSKEQLDTIAKNNLPLLKQMNKAVGLYEKDAKKTGLSSAPGLAATLNLSGKQRMLSQKMSKEFFLIALGYEVEDNKLNLLETYSLFDRTLKGLKDGDETLGLPGTEPEHIRKQLDVVNGLWQDFKPLVEAGSSHNSSGITPEQVTQIANLNLPLLKEMNAAVQLYEAEAAK
ncbi:type IV pili methyl-accepting chemotaxis transducer N-terminal domain-containing protein [Vibrio hannami]|uniref:type IV pili methyl-accepting chemotaxis transducer N-terminal domain-containing protein n=1 Tax=Vibrio hannami TaxID=2717094 RepID=UPI00240F5350|nr:type IV pili methyl-accepting chemotaxis transducer N-terminal domain-containing protein [Vibrio hannami]MDG3086055.1 type IV pili methyl-accepting chemotaxis transducer N-terminal domain-containing protein [Vibrio hannami]